MVVEIRSRISVVSSRTWGMAMGMERNPKKMNGFGNWLGLMPSPVMRQVKSVFAYSFLEPGKVGHGVSGVCRGLIWDWSHATLRVCELGQAAGVVSLPQFWSCDTHSSACVRFQMWRQNVRESTPLCKWHIAVSLLAPGAGHLAQLLPEKHGCPHHCYHQQQQQ